MTGSDPQTFFGNARFKLEWRPYQTRVLNEFDRLIQDRCFHIVAAPGSGKTVLGLEAIRRIAKPALILSPTLGIRDQWISRFCDLFTCEDPRSAFSTDLARPALLTADTYQGLHAFCRKTPVDVLAAALVSAGVQTLILDEAHHLRNEWWQSLFELKKLLQKPFVIALTATPPYDVSQVEWNRYSALCGPIDAEISIPELVKVNNLCPHQDFIYFSKSTSAEAKKTAEFLARTRSLLHDLALNQKLLQAIEQHPALRAPLAHMEAVLDQTEYFISLAVFLKHASGLEPVMLLRCMGLKGLALPEFNRRWAEILLNGLLFHDRASFGGHEETLRELQKELSALSTLEKKRVYLCAQPAHTRLVQASGVKLSAIAEIVELENRHLMENLRMLILTDFVRADCFPDYKHMERSGSKIGVVPIFEHLRKLQFPHTRLAIATAKLVVIPDACLERFLQLLQSLAPQCSLPQATPLWHAPQYLQLEYLKNRPLFLHEIFARLLSEGLLQIIVGTNAFLGEGWDAPSLNALILATTARTFMSSNQLRGRAIRSDPLLPAKTANIWHLCCFNAADGDDRETEQDWTMLHKRFQSIYGVAFSATVIENGVERLGIDPGTLHPDHLAQINALMCQEAEARESLPQKWQTALFANQTSGDRMFQELFIPVSRFPGRPVLEHQRNAGSG